MDCFSKKKGIRASEGDLEQQRRVLHRNPRDFESFVAETVRKWKRQAA